MRFALQRGKLDAAGVLPKTFNLFTSTLLKELLKKVSEIPATLDYDAFGRIYEYFLGAFAMTEWQGTPKPRTKSSTPANGELRYLAVSTKQSPEICDYPDSGKFGVLAEYLDRLSQAVKPPLVVR